MQKISHNKKYLKKRCYLCKHLHVCCVFYLSFTKIQLVWLLITWFAVISAHLV